jgi:hypothetical protein
MKKILPFLIIILFIICGLNSIAIEKKIDYEFTFKLNDPLIYIAPISIPNTQEYLIINKNGEQTNEELKIYSISYKQHSKNIKDDIEIKKQLRSNEMQNNITIYDYVIITTENLYSAITSSTFIGWKTLIGYNVKIINITDNEIASQDGQDLPEKIRNFLRLNYKELGIKYVLIVGNHATIPMRYCYPDPTNHRFDIFDWTSGEVPTDYYYADLSSSDADSWDLDGDGYYGEYEQDDPDFFPEVYVGRIPSNIQSRVTYTLDKITTFEQDIGEWKENVLHAGAFFYFTNEDNSGNPAMDGAMLSHYIENYIMGNWTISHYSEQKGLETSFYNWSTLSETAFINDWRNGKYSIVNWQGHGWTNRVARKVWSWDDGDNVPEGNEISWIDFINTNSNLDDDFPSIITAESCYVGCPEPASGGNLGIDLLTDPSMGASIGVIASARSPYGSLDWPNNLGGSDSIIYEFNRFIINDSKTVGEALYDSKYFCNLNYGWDHYAEYIDMFTFNLFGEPSLIIKGINVENHPPDKPTITGDSSGKPGTEYKYTFVSTDPEEDQISYYIDWGDNTSTVWTGTLPSGEYYNFSHTWSEKGDYTIKAKAKDTYGAESNWATLEISMPKTYIYNPIMQLLLKMLERFPFFEKILNQILL